MIFYKCTQICENVVPFEPSSTLFSKWLLQFVFLYCHCRSKWQSYSNITHSVVINCAGLRVNQHPKTRKIALPSLLIKNYFVRHIWMKSIFLIGTIFCHNLGFCWRYCQLINCKNANVNVLNLRVIVARLFKLIPVVFI